MLLFFPPPVSENILGWYGPKSLSTEPMKNGALSSLTSASANLTWAIVPTGTQEEQMQSAVEVSMVICKNFKP